MSFTKKWSTGQAAAELKADLREALQESGMTDEELTLLMFTRNKTEWDTWTNLCEYHKDTSDYNIWHATLTLRMRSWNRQHPTESINAL